MDLSRGEKIDAIYLSPDGFAHRTSESSIAEQMGAVFVANKMPHLVEVDNDRVGGWMQMYEMLQNSEWQIGDNCKAVIETLPMLTRDEKKPEDGIKFEGCHSWSIAKTTLSGRAGRHSSAAIARAVAPKR